MLGGRELGEDLGYGPMRLLEPDEVASISTALAAQDRCTLAGRFDRGRMEALQIYPTGIWDEQDVLDAYLLPSLEELAGLYARAAASGQPVVLLLT